MTVINGNRPVSGVTSTGGASNAAALSLINEARSQLGWREGPNNNNPYTRHVMGDANQPWCAAFVSTMLERQNIPGISRRMFSASARGLATQFQQAGRFVPSGAGQPQPGDAIFFGRRPGEHHVGIVQKVENGRVYTVEGNSGNKVSERVYSLNDPGISGYGRVFGEGQVSGDIGVDTSQAGRGTAGSAPSGRAQGRGSSSRALDNGIDATSYFSPTSELMAALLAILRGGDPEQIAQVLAKMFPYMSMEDLQALGQLLKHNPELSQMLTSNPELLQQLASNPEAVQELIKADRAAKGGGWNPSSASPVAAPTGGWRP